MAVYKDARNSEHNLPSSTSHFDLLRREEPLSEASLLTLLKLLSTGSTPIKDTESFQLQSEVYYSCLEYLKAHDENLFEFVSNKLSHELINDNLRVKMKHPFRSTIASQIYTDLVTQLQYNRDRSDVATKEFLNNIKCVMPASVFLGELQKDFIEPDLQIAFFGQRPGIVIEVAWSEPLKALSQKAERVLSQTDGDVQLFIIVKCSYNAGNNVNVYSWRSEHGKVKMQEQKVFDRGTIYPGSIIMRLRDFAHPAVLARFAKADLNLEVSLKYDRLVDIVRHASWWGGLRAKRHLIQEVLPEALTSPPTSRKFSTLAMTQPRFISQRNEKVAAMGVPTRSIATYPTSQLIRPRYMAHSCLPTRMLPTVGLTRYRPGTVKSPHVTIASRGLSFCLAAASRFRRH